MGRDRYNGYTNGIRDKHTELKIPIQVTVDVCIFAQATDAMEQTGFRANSKSMVLDEIIKFFMVNYGKKGRPFDTLGALDYLASINLPVIVDNKRHKKALDMYTRDTQADGFIVPFGNDKVRAITSQQGVFNHDAQKLADEIHRKMTLQQQAQQLACEAPNLDRFTEAARLREKESLGLDAGGAVVCEEDQQSYNEYVAKQQVKGKMPATIADFLSGNIPIDPS